MHICRMYVMLIAAVRYGVDCEEEEKREPRKRIKNKNTALNFIHPLLPFSLLVALGVFLVAIAMAVVAAISHDDVRVSVRGDAG